jgi:nitroimidazol reductase NimA-like FMN-containing flavoprotein (pyridoxamine 5'-phosphate oxidase superfamily)
MSEDEPALGADFARAEPSAELADPSVKDRIRRLAASQHYAVLSTQGGEQPYASLIAFAISDDLAHATFATPTATRKYRLLSECHRVALLVDNRSDGQGRMMEIEAFTATGLSHLLERGEERERWASLLVRRHPQLDSFVASPTSALFRIDIVRYFHVSRFQEVLQWSPTEPGSSR